MRTRLALPAIALGVALTPALSSGQVMPTRVVPAPNRGLALSDGEPISYLLEHSGVLDLTDDQKESLMDIRRWLRQQTAPFMRQMDSVREYLGISLERRVRREDIETLERFQAMTLPLTDSIRFYNDAARGEARQVLDSAQAVRLDSLVVAERRVLPRRRPPPGR